MSSYDICRKAAAESSVLLKNDGNLLPLKKGAKVALFGRIQTTYYRCGTGSGGGIKIEKEPMLLPSLRENPDIVIDEALASVYEKWVEENPFDDGKGVWAGEPWFQKEMPLEDSLVCEASKRNDVAVIFIGRTAGEDHDNAEEKGSYLLTDGEEDMIAAVTKYFKNVIVVLNVSNIIDLSFIKRYDPSSVLYVFHGGMAGSDAFSDLLSGKAAPSGKLPDTQAVSISAYPAYKNFGGSEVNIYEEDIYVGYRYFETFDRESVIYPFGYGLTYTTFSLNTNAFEENGVITVNTAVTNTGNREGKEVVQVYVKAPSGKLGKPSRSLIAFKKTKNIAAGGAESVSISFSVSEMASYDDGGATGNKSCYVLEGGDYEIYVGTDVRSAELVFTYTHEKTTVVKKCEEAMSPVTPFKRLKAGENGEKLYEDTPLCTVDVIGRIHERRPDDIAFTGDKGIKLPDVKNGKNTLDEFIAQLTDEQLASLTCGEGANSPKATPGTVGAMGGQSPDLDAFGIPVCCVADGPAGVKFSGDKKSTLIPIGTLLAASFDTELVEEVYSCIGRELKAVEVDSLLGPGLNIHRHPLCGRNFEYYSEDPVLTGKISAAATRGIAVCGAYATIKHLCANSQEAYRTWADSVVSERALREIYLKGFEISVKEGKNVLIMTSYNSINGYWAATNYDLTTIILRDEWGFENLVMTDWWACLNLERGKDWSKDRLDAMVRSGNDVYMVCKNALTKSASVTEGLKNGTITRGELQRNVKNILKWIMNTDTFDRYVKRGCVPQYSLTIDTNNLNQMITAIGNVVPGQVYNVPFEKGKKALFIMNVICTGAVLSQNPVSFTVDGNTTTSLVEGGTDSTITVQNVITVDENSDCKLTFDFSESIKIEYMVIKQ